jgi:hypothetical protein
MEDDPDRQGLSDVSDMPWGCPDQAVMPTPPAPPVPSGWWGLIYGIRWRCRAWSPLLKGPGVCGCVLVEDGSQRGGARAGMKGWARGDREWEIENGVGICMYMFMNVQTLLYRFTTTLHYASGHLYQPRNTCESQLCSGSASSEQPASCHQSLVCTMYIHCTYMFTQCMYIFIHSTC